MKKYLEILAIVFLTISALTSFAQNKKFTLTGIIHGVKDSTLVNLYALDEQVILDSAYTKGGKFTLTGHVDQPTICWLRCTNEYATIIVENTNMQFESPLKNMVLDHKASGGKEQALLNKLNKLQYPYNKRYRNALDSLQNKKYTDDADKKRLVDVFNKAQDSSMVIYVDFGKRNMNSYYGQDIVYRNRKNIHRDTLEELYKNLSATFKETVKGRAFKTFLYESLADKGKPMIEFEANTFAGKPFKLSSLKGKYIYLSFGSVGCSPCRMENKEIARIHERMSNDISFVSFSLDKNIKAWQIMTKEDGIVWYNVSDMKGEASKIKILYNVQAIPAAYLIDKQGVIVEKYEGYFPGMFDEIERRIKGK